MTAPLSFVKDFVPEDSCVLSEYMMFTPMVTFTFGEGENTLTKGVVVDPTCVRQNVAGPGDSEFGVMFRSPNGYVRGQLVAPVFNDKGSEFQAGDTYDFAYRIVYNDAITTLLDLLNNWYKEGRNIPKVTFYTNSYSGDTVRDLYYKFYQGDKYANVWFAPKGKPLIIGVTKNNNNASDQTKYYPGWDNFVADEFLEYFDVRESEWPNGDHNDNSIPWMSWDYPQRIHNGSIAVPVAQHSHSRISVSYKDPECSRGYNNKTRHVEGDINEGLSFQQMWETALNEDNHITNALVCSFNEWMAIKSFVLMKVFFSYLQPAKLKNNFLMCRFLTKFYTKL